MDLFTSPVQYFDLAEQELQSHLRYCASNLANGARAEVLLCEAQVVVPLIKRGYRAKPTILEVVIRSGSVGRNALNNLRDKLSIENYPLKLSFTPKGKLLSRIIVPLPIEGGTVAITSVGVVRSISLEIGIEWPGPVAVGYDFLPKGVVLPGRIVSRDPLFAVGYKVGETIGTVVKKTLS